MNNPSQATGSLVSGKAHDPGIGLAVVMFTVENGMFAIENRGHAGVGIQASSCIHKSESDLQGMLNVRSP